MMGNLSLRIRAENLFVQTNPKQFDRAVWRGIALLGSDNGDLRFPCWNLGQVTRRGTTAIGVNV